MSPRVMSPRVGIEHRSTAPGLLGWLERELGSLPGLHVFDSERVMRCEEYREPGRVVVRAELPGIDPATDVAVTVEHGVLKIKAHRREVHREHLRSEIFYGEMVRTLILPPGCDATAVTATYRAGVLEVAVPVDPPAG